MNLFGGDSRIGKIQQLSWPLSVCFIVEVDICLDEQLATIISLQCKRGPSNWVHFFSEALCPSGDQSAPQRGSHHTVEVIYLARRRPVAHVACKQDGVYLIGHCSCNRSCAELHDPGCLQRQTNRLSRASSLRCGTCCHCHVVYRDTCFSAG